MMVSIMISSVVTQQAGTATENQPPIQVQECTSSGCRTISTSVTIDANWRYNNNNYNNNNIIIIDFTSFVVLLKVVLVNCYC